MNDVPPASETKEKKSHPWRKRFLYAFVLLVLALVGARVALPTVVNGWLTDLLTEQLNLDLTIDDIDIDLRAGHVVLNGIEAEVDGKHLASVREAVADLDVYEVVFGDGGTIKIVFHGLLGHIEVEDGGRLNLGRIGPPDDDADSDAEPSAPTEPVPANSRRLYLDMSAEHSQLTIHDAASDPSNPLEVYVGEAKITATRVLVEGPSVGADLLDVRFIGAVGEKTAPALFSAGFWSGGETGGTYLELHAAVTGLDIRKIPQWVTPDASSILGGDVFHVSGTAIAHHGVIETGLIEIDVEGSSSDVELKFGGPLDAPVFDMDSPVLEAFRLGYLRVVDSGSGLLSGAASLGKSLWDRTSGVFTHTASGVGHAVTEFSLKRLGEGIWDGISGIFTGGDNDDEDAAAALKERREKWARWAQRQLEFRKLYMERRLAVAKQLEPPRVPYFQAELKNRLWAEELESLVPAEARKKADEESQQDQE